MGNLLRKLFLAGSNGTRGVKRPRTEDDDDGDDFDENDDGKRFKLSTGEQHVYNSFFVEGREHNVLVRALGREWKLHRLFLERSAYFKAIFDAHDSADQILTVDLNFDNTRRISVEALNIVLGSFYNCEVRITYELAFEILIVARHLQLDEIAAKVEEFLKLMIVPHNCVALHVLATRLAMPSLQAHSFHWLSINLFSLVVRSSLNKILIAMTPELWMKLLQSPQLVVISEIHLYRIMKCFVQLHLIIQRTGNDREARLRAETRQLDPHFFKDMARDEPGAFLESERGRTFAGIFRALRLGNLVHSLHHLNEIAEDNLIPQSWLQQFIVNRWLTQLMFAESSPMLPNFDNALAMQEFESNAIRLCEVVSPGGMIFNWRLFGGFLFGLKLHLTFDGRTCRVRRIDNLNARRRVLVRVQGIIAGTTSVIVNADREIQEISFDAGNLERILFELEEEISKPLILAFELIFVRPRLQ